MGRVTPIGTRPKCRHPRRAIPLTPRDLPPFMRGQHVHGLKCSRCGSMSIQGTGKPSRRQRVMAWIKRRGRKAEPQSTLEDSFRQHTCQRPSRPHRARSGNGPSLPIKRRSPRHLHWHSFRDPEIAHWAELARLAKATMVQRTLFWVGGTGTWNATTTTHISLSSGGAGGVAPPVAGDIMVFDGNSGTGTITSTAGVATCGSLVCDGSLGSGTYKGTWVTGTTFNAPGATGKLYLSTTMTVTASGTTTITGSGTLAFKFYTKTFSAISQGGVVATLQSNIALNGAWTLPGAGLTTNNHSITATSMSSTGNSTRTLTFGSSAINLTGTGTAWSVSGSNMTITANTAVVTCSGNGVTLSHATTNPNGLSVRFTGINTNAWNSGNSGWGSFTYAPASGTGTGALVLDQNMTLSGNFTLTGNVAPFVPIVESSVIGSARIISCGGTVALTGRMDFMDVTGAGTATWTLATNGGNAGGNSGITFATAIPQFRVGAGGNWSAATRWATSSGGTGGSGRVPFPQDPVTLDAHATGTITADCLRASNTWTSATFTGTITGGTAISIFGNATFGAANTLTAAGNFTLTGRGARTLRTNGCGMSLFIVQFGTWTLADTYVAANASRHLDVLGGSFSAGPHNVTVGSCVNTIIGGLTATINMGSGTWTLTNTGVIWRGNAPLTVNAQTSTLVIADTSITSKTLTLSYPNVAFHNVVITPGGIGPIIFGGLATALSFNSFTSLGNKHITFLAASTITCTPGGWNVHGTAFGYIALPGGVGNFATTPASAALQVAGSIDIRWYGALTTWTAGTQVVLSMLSATAKKGYRLFMSGGAIILDVANTTLDQVASSAHVPFAGGSSGWIRATWNSATKVVTFYTATAINPGSGTWTQLGVTRTITLASIAAATIVLGIGGGGTTGANPVTGKLYRAQVLNGITGTIVFDATFGAKKVSANSFQESSSNHATVTINGATAQLGDGRVMLTSSTPGTAWTLSMASGEAWVSNASLQDVHATGGATFRAVAANTNLVSNDTGWVSYAATMTASLSAVSSLSATPAETGTMAGSVSITSTTSGAMMGTGQMAGTIALLTSLSGSPTGAGVVGAMAYDLAAIKAVTTDS